jgi:TRAP-type transport system small permease protein
MAAGEEKKGVKAALDAILKKLTAVTNGVLFAIMVSMGVILAANIVLRFLFDAPITWANVITRYSYIYIVLLGTAISYIEGSHAEIDFIYYKVSKRTKTIFNLCHYLAMMFLCAILMIFGIKHVITMWHAHSPVLTSLSIGYVYLSVPISAAIIFFFLIIKIFELKSR